MSGGRGGRQSDEAVWEVEGGREGKEGKREGSTWEWRCESLAGCHRYKNEIPKRKRRREERKGRMNQTTTVIVLL